MAPAILITGATGNVGASVVQQLQQQGVSCRVAVRQVDRAQSLLSDRSQAVRFDFLDPATFPKAFAGITRLFLVRPPALSNINQIAPATNDQ